MRRRYRLSNARGCRRGRKTGKKKQRWRGPHGAGAYSSDSGGRWKDRGLAGTRSLKIDLLQTPADADRVVTFHSLGVAPELVVTLANRSRFSALGWGLALLVGLIGVAITRRPARTKIAFLLAVAVLATLVPLAVDSIEAAYVCNRMFYAVCILALYYLAAGAVRRLGGVVLSRLPVSRGFRGLRLGGDSDGFVLRRRRECGSRGEQCETASG